MLGCNYSFIHSTQTAYRSMLKLTRNTDRQTDTNTLSRNIFRNVCTWINVNDTLHAGSSDLRKNTKL